MDMLFKSIPDLKLRDKIRHDDTVDQLHHFVTVSLLVAFAVIAALKEFTGGALDCWISSQTGKHYQGHANEYCWAHKLYSFPNPDNHAEVPYELSPVHGGPLNASAVKNDDLGEINFYRWVSIIFLIQALMFKVPNMIWSECNEYSGTRIQKMVTMIESSSFETKENKDMTFARVAEYMEIWLKIDRKPFSFMRDVGGQRTQKILRYCMLCVGANTGNTLSTTYLLVKALFLLNVFCQFFILTAFLDINFWEYGTTALRIYHETGEEMDTTNFPRVALCHFQERGNGYWIQCLLTINMLLEKFFILEWFWMLFLFVLTIYSFGAWLLRILMTSLSVKFVKKYLAVFNRSGSIPEEGEKTVNNFVSQYLGNDGVFMLRILAVNSNDVVMAELVCNMWKRYLDFQYNAVDPKEQSEGPDSSNCIS